MSVPTVTVDNTPPSVATPDSNLPPSVDSVATPANVSGCSPNNATALIEVEADAANDALADTTRIPAALTVPATASELDDVLIL